MKPVSDEVKRARGSYRAHPERDPERNAEERKAARRRILAAVRALQAGAMELLELELSDYRFRRLRGELEAGRQILGALIDFESDEFAIHVQISTCRPGQSWNEVDRTLAKVRDEDAIRSTPDPAGVTDR